MEEVLKFLNNQQNKKLVDLIKEAEESNVSPPYMYSPLGFGCHVCKFHYIEGEKHMCKSKHYHAYMGTHELVDNEGNPIKDPSKWCSNWFLPKNK